MPNFGGRGDSADEGGGVRYKPTTRDRWSNGTGEGKCLGDRS